MGLHKFICWKLPVNPHATTTIAISEALHVQLPASPIVKTTVGVSFFREFCPSCRSEPEGLCCWTFSAREYRIICLQKWAETLSQLLNILYWLKKEEQVRGETKIRKRGSITEPNLWTCVEFRKLFNRSPFRKHDGAQLRLETHHYLCKRPRGEITPNPYNWIERPIRADKKLFF